jgi:ketosteroid isomerase-like protein
VTSEEARSVALGFLGAYWRGDLDDALGRCVPGAIMELPQSLPLPSPAPVEDLLPRIFAGVYRRFAGGRFDVDVETAVAGAAPAGRSLVAVEYVARGALATGGEFRCRYCAFVTVIAGRVGHVRAYTDTRYLADVLLN